MRTLIHMAVLLLLIFTESASAQDVSFAILASPGDSLRTEGNLIGAIEAYRKNIAANKNKPHVDTGIDRILYVSDLYNIGATFSVMGQQDSAVFYLDWFGIESNDSTDEILSDPNLYKIRTALAWPKLEDRIIRNYTAKTKTVLKDPAYAKQLWLLKARDQAYYEDINKAEQKIGKSSSVVIALWDFKKTLGVQNLTTLEALIKQKGWPRITQVGQHPATAAFLIIQHANLAKQQQYLPVIKKLCEQGEARWQDYALMYDRTQTGIDKPQRYGSQVRYNNQSEKYELLPLEDPAQVDFWRKEAGLSPLSTYLMQWNITWPETKQ